MSVPPFIRLLSEQVRSEPLLQIDDRVVVAVSGGPDSMALLHGLVGLNQHSDFRLHLHIAHLNHQLRGEAAEQDAAFVQAAADHLDLPCTIERRDIRAIAEGHSGVAHREPLPAEEATWLGYGPTVGAVEEVARNERYALFERVALSIGAGVVCVGHQADDNAETILHRMVRGTGLRGIAGIPVRRALRPGSEIVVVRPLLRFTRRKLLEFLDESGIPHREDESNAYPAPDDILARSGGGGVIRTRNLVRNVVIPLLESKLNPHVREALLRLAEQARWTDEYVRDTAQRTFETVLVSRGDGELVLSARGLSRRHRIVQAELARQAIATFHLGEQDLSFAHLSAVCGLLAGRTSGKRVQLPGGLTVTKRYDRLIFALPGDGRLQLPAAEIGVHVPGRTVLPIRRLELICEILDPRSAGVPARLPLTDAPDAASAARPAAGSAGNAGSAPVAESTRQPRNRYDESIDFDTLTLPLVVRRRRRGERFWPLGAPGSKKLSEFLADAKVDPLERDRIAVLCDQLGPIWVIGHRIAERVKRTPKTQRILHIRVGPL